MSALLRKQFTDIRDYVRGSAHFQLEERAFTGWAYPLDLEFTLIEEQAYYTPRDAAGIPMRAYSSAGTQYNPTRIASWGLAHFNRLGQDADADQNSRAAFLLAADWFAARDDGLWEYRFDWNDLRSPWLSCMAQGQGISVLARAYQYTGNERYLRVARAALKPLALPIDEGGVRSRLDGRWTFLEEYPSRNPAHVLNGFLFALMGLSDLQRVDAEAVEQVGFDAFLDTMETNVDRWDLGYWSAYDLASGPAALRNAATPSYHRLHVSQLGFLGRRHASNPLIVAAERWEAQSASLPNRLRALTAKLSYRALVRTQR